MQYIPQNGLVLGSMELLFQESRANNGIIEC